MSAPYLVVDAPEGLNRLWFVGRLLGARPAPEGDLIRLLSPGVLRRLDPLVGERARIQWESTWADACRLRREGMAAGAMDCAPAPEAPPDVGAAAAASEDAFRQWWAGPLGAKFALCWLADQLRLPEDVRRTLQRRTRTTYLDLVGDDDLVERDGPFYLRIGAGAVFPPKTSTLRQLLG